jgi:YgiT-type zinc finger domain-containing protein
MEKIMKIREGTTCPVCEKGKMMLIQRDTDFEYKGITIVFKNCPIIECENVINGCEGAFIEDGFNPIVNATLEAFLKAIKQYKI